MYPEKIWICFVESSDKKVDGLFAAIWRATAMSTYLDG